MASILNQYWTSWQPEEFVAEEMKLTHWGSYWGEQPDQQFGHRLRIAADGTRMLVSDTERHRIVHLDWQQRKVIAQFGETDKAGDDLNHVNQPTLLSLRGSRAIVADSGNQRILKLVID